MPRSVSTSFLSAVLLSAVLLPAAAAQAQDSRDTLSVGAVVVAPGCTAGTGVSPDAPIRVRCAGMVAPGIAHHAVMTGSGGIAGPDDADDPRVIVAY